MPLVRLYWRRVNLSPPRIGEDVMSFRNTREAAQLLGISESRLSRAVWTRRVDPPVKSPAGDFLWTRADVERASWQLLGRALNLPTDSPLTAEAPHVAT
jgi:hypothetical protein